MSDNDYMYKQHKHLDTESLAIIFKYLKRYFGRIRTINGMLPDPKTGNIEIKTTSDISVDTVYPVGSVYLTVAATDPSVLFPGTTWKRLESGKFLMAATDINRAGATGGVDTQTYTIPLPKHTHSVASVSSTGSHTHTRGTMNITGKGMRINKENFNGVGCSDAIVASNSYTGGGGECGDGNFHSNTGNIWGFDLDASKGWTGETSNNGAHTHSVVINEAGTGSTVKIEPPYFTVNVWQRIS